MDLGIILTVLWPYLVALYILDCFLVVRGGHILFTGTASAGFRRTGSGLRFTGLLPWSWSVLSAGGLPTITEKGIYIGATPFPDELRPIGLEDLDLVPFDGIRKVRRDGRKVLVDGRVIHVAPTGVAASCLVKRIQGLLETSGNERQMAIEAFMEDAFDLRGQVKTVEKITRRTATLGYAGTFLFFLVFLLLPVSLVVRASPYMLWVELILILMVYLSAIVMWWKVHKCFLPEETGDRVEELIFFVFFPVGVIHALGKLTRRLLVPFDSTTLTAVLVPERAEEALKREFIRTRTVVSGSEQGSDLKTVWKRRMNLIKELAREVKIDPDRLERFTVHGVGVHETVCPLCSATYREGIMECADCQVTLHATSDSFEGKGRYGGRQNLENLNRVLS